MGHRTINLSPDLIANIKECTGIDCDKKPYSKNFQKAYKIIQKKQNTGTKTDFGTSKRDLENFKQPKKRKRKTYNTEGFIKAKDKRKMMVHTRQQKTLSNLSDIKEILKNEYGLTTMKDKTNEPKPRNTTHKAEYCPDCEDMENNESYSRPSLRCDNCKNFIPKAQGLNGSCPSCGNGVFENITNKDWLEIENNVVTGDEDEEEDSDEEGEGEDEDE